MSVGPIQDLRQIHANLMWVLSDAPSGPDHPDWKAAAVTLHSALTEALGRLESAGVCRGCGKPLGAYCIECAWPHKRRSERRKDT